MKNLKRIMNGIVRMRVHVVGQNIADKAIERMIITETSVQNISENQFELVEILLKSIFVGSNEDKELID
jgi:hypothetical protein